MATRYTLISHTQRTYDGHETTFEAHDDDAAREIIAAIVAAEEGSAVEDALLAECNMWDRLTAYYARRNGYHIAVIETRYLKL